MVECIYTLHINIYTYDTCVLNIMYICITYVYTMYVVYDICKTYTRI